MRWNILIILSLFSYWSSSQLFYNAAPSRLWKTGISHRHAVAYHTVAVEQSPASLSNQDLINSTQPLTGGDNSPTSSSAEESIEAEPYKKRVQLLLANWRLLVVVLTPILLLPIIIAIPNNSVRRWLWLSGHCSRSISPLGHWDGVYDLWTVRRPALFLRCSLPSHALLTYGCLLSISSLMAMMIAPVKIGELE